MWDADGNEFIEYGMGLRAVTLGHAYPPSSKRWRVAALWVPTSRGPARSSWNAQRHSCVIASAEMVKFTKDGSTATRPPLKLARQVHGARPGGHLRRPSLLLLRRLVHQHDDHGRRASRRRVAIVPCGFRYNDLDSRARAVRRATRVGSPA